MQPFCAPFSRRMRVSLRVSMSAMPTMPFAREVGARSLGRAEVRHQPRQIADHEAGGEGPARLDVLGIDADVADVRIRQRDDLPA